MKLNIKYLLLGSILALPVAKGFAQGEIENFESEEFIIADKFQDGGLVPSLNETWGGVDKVLAITNNPKNDGINDSYYCAYAIRNGGGNKDFQAEFNIEEQTLEGVKYIHIMVLKPKHSVLQLSGRQNQPETGNCWDNRFTSTAYYYNETENEWTDVVFRVNFGTGLKFDRLCLQLDNVHPEGRYTENTQIYFDEIIVNDDPTPRGMDKPYPAPKVSFPEDFEGTQTIADKLFFGSLMYWNTTDKDINLGLPLHEVVENPEINIINPSSKVLKLIRKKEATWWSRVRFVLNDGKGLQVTAANRYVHVLLKKKLNNEVSLFVTTMSGKNFEWIKPKYNYDGPGWQDLVFELPEDVLNQTISLLHLNPHSTDFGEDLEIYVDNIDLNDKSEPITPIINVEPLCDFAGIASGQTKSIAIPFEIKNLNEPISIVVEGEGFSCKQTELVTQDGALTGDLNVDFTPTVAGTRYTAKLKFMVNGASAHEVVLTGDALQTSSSLKLDFENGAFVEGTLANACVGGLDEVLDICDNAEVGGLNKTSKAAYMMKSIEGNQVFEAHLNTAPFNVVGKKYIHVMVHKPSHSKMTLALRSSSYAGGADVDLYKVNAFYYERTENEWVDVVFEIDGKGHMIDRLVLDLDNCIAGDRYTANAKIMFDEIIMNDDVMPRGMQDSYIYPKYYLPEGFGTTSTIANPRYFGNSYEWVGDSKEYNMGRSHEEIITNPFMTDAANQSQNVLKLTRRQDATWWGRMRFHLKPAVTISDDVRYLHIMVKKPTDGELAAHFFNDKNEEKGWVRPLVNYIAGEWEDMVFMIPEDFSGDLTAFDFNPHSTGASEDMDIYIDEIELMKTPDPRYILVDKLNKTEKKSQVRLYATDESLYIGGIEPGAELMVVSLDGRVVTSLVAPSEELSIKTGKGVFVVKVKSSSDLITRKVIVH